MAPRKPKTNPSGLLEAMKFISVAQHSEGTLIQTHCRLSNGSVIAFDGGLTVGHNIEELLNVCPHTQTFIAALSKCQDSISITVMDSGKLSIKSGKFRATVPCVQINDLPGVLPDPPIATLTDAIKNALSACLPLVQDNQPETFKCGVLLQANTAVSTNKISIIEAWHGVDLPSILIPKVSAQAIAKSDKKLSKFGYSGNSATFYFEDNSFIKTQLFDNYFPKYEQLLNINSNPSILPNSFYEALENVAPFVKDGKVYFIDDKICSESLLEDGTSYEVSGIPNGMIFDPAQLKLVKPHAHTMHFRANDRGLSLFFNEDNTVRGAIMPIGKNGN